MEALAATTVPLLPVEPVIEPNDLAVLALACQQGERLRFRYASGSGQASRRHVEPYRLVSTGRRWYLVAHAPTASVRPPTPIRARNQDHD